MMGAPRVSGKGIEIAQVGEISGKITILFFKKVFFVFTIKHTRNINFSDSNDLFNLRETFFFEILQKNMLTVNLFVSSRKLQKFGN